MTIPSGSLDSYADDVTGWGIDTTKTTINLIRRLTAMTSGAKGRVVISGREDLSGYSRECIIEEEDGKCEFFDIDGSFANYYIGVEPDFLGSYKLTSVKINGEAKDIAFPTGMNVYEVGVKDAYSVEIEGIVEPHYNIMWANDGANVSGTDYDDPEILLKNGSAKVVKVYDNATGMNDISDTIEHIDEGCLDPDGKGYISLVEGNVVIFEFTPKYGYQLTSVSANGTNLEPQEAINQYKYIMPATNIHFQATFTETKDVVKSTTDKISNGSISIGEDEIDAGSTVLSVKDAVLSEEERTAFEDKAGEYEIENIFDIKLDQVFYKGSTDDSDVWSRPLGHDEDLTVPATITFKLDDIADGKKVVVIHEKEEGVYEALNTTYNDSTHSVSFSTRSFSNFALASRDYDVSNPTGEIAFKENKFYSLLNTITFGLFFNENIEVTITADDDNGISKIEYLVTDTQKTLQELTAETNWKLYNNKFNISDEDKYIVYAKITDVVDKVTYISSDGFIIDKTEPGITGISTNNGVHYTTQRFGVNDSYIDKVLIDGVEVEEYVLPGNVDKTYEIDAVDKAGNATYLSIRMMPISTIAGLLEDYTVENVTLEDKEDIEAVKNKVTSIDTTNATDDEKTELQAIIDKCDSLLGAIDDKYISEVEFTVTPPKAGQTVGDNTFEVVSKHDNVVISVKEWKKNGGSEVLPEEYVFEEDIEYIPILKAEVKNSTYYFDENTTLTVHGSTWGNGEETYSLKDHRNYGYVKELSSESFLVDEMTIKVALEPEPEEEPEEEPKEEPGEENPNTGDEIVLYLIIGSMSLVSLAGCLFCLKRHYDK